MSTPARDTLAPASVGMLGADGAAPERWNPRFEAYAASQGLTPAEVLERDRALYPGGCMTGFILHVLHPTGDSHAL